LRILRTEVKRRRLDPAHARSGSPAITPDLDDLMTVSELSADILYLMASRIEASRTVEQIVYRETELDEVWRIADLALARSRARVGERRGAAPSGIAEVAALVHAAHDLIGDTEDIAAAAAELRKAAVLAASIPALAHKAG
jgi:hypothetical protein